MQQLHFLIVFKSCTRPKTLLMKDNHNYMNCYPNNYCIYSRICWQSNSREIIGKFQYLRIFIFPSSNVINCGTFLRISKTNLNFQIYSYSICYLSWVLVGLYVSINDTFCARRLNVVLLNRGWLPTDKNLPNGNYFCACSIVSIKAIKPTLSKDIFMLPRSNLMVIACTAFRSRSKDFLILRLLNVG